MFYRNVDFRTKIRISNIPLSAKQNCRSKSFSATSLGRLVLAMLFSLTACGGPAKIVEPPNSVSWTPPTTYNDGTPLVGLSKYRLYYGTSDYLLQAVIDINTTGSSHSFTASEIDAIGSRMIANRSHFFALTVIDNDGIESGFSDSLEFIPL